MSTEYEQKQLSKFMAYILRHKAHEFGLTLDECGFVGLTEFLKKISSTRRFSWVTEDNILDVVYYSDKRRFEIDDDKIRATYGHSLANEIVYPDITPPEFLFQGTTDKFADVIREKGLQPMGRQYVHLSEQEELAYEVGLRRTSSPVIVKVHALKAHQDGIRFFKADEGIYLTKEVPAEYVE